MGRPDAAAGHPEPARAFAGGKPVAQRRPQSQQPRHGPLGHRTADRRRRQPAGRRGPGRSQAVMPIRFRSAAPVGTGARTAFALSSGGRISLPVTRRREASHPHAREGRGRFADRRHHPQPFRHHRRTAHQGIRPVLRTGRGRGPPRHFVGCPNLLVGAMVILPVWFLLYLFRPPGGSGQKQD